jgi:hypothetical protein
MGTHRYRIVVAGHLRAADRETFGDLQIEPNGHVTVLLGDKDQAGLHGVLNRIRQLELELVELSRVSEGS